MKIFITGATGYIGEKLAIKLNSEKNDVYALVESREKGQILAAEGVKIIKGDLLNKKLLCSAMKDCDVVFHLGAYTNNLPDNEVDAWKTNVEGTRNVLEAAENNHIKKLVFTSTAEIFGPSTDSNKIDEKSIRQVPFFNNFDSSIAEAEGLILAYAKKGFHAVIVSPSLVYGPGKSTEPNAITQMIEQYHDGKMMLIRGTGKKYGSFCFIDDVVDGHLKAMERGKSGENYMFGGENVHFDYLFKLIKKYSGTDKIVFKVPVSLLSILSKFRLFSSEFIKKNPLFSYRWLKTSQFNWNISSTKAIEELGYKITPLETGIKRTIDWINNTEEEKVYTLITGSSSGIGKAMAEECAKKNYNLILVALPDTGLEKVGNEIHEKYNVDVRYYEVNLTEEGAVNDLYNWVDVQSLKIDKLINNAGVGDSSCFESTELDYYLKMMQINSQAVVSLTSTFIPKLKEHEQSYILNMGSFAGLMPVPYKSVYSATKSFVVAFSRALQMELKQFGIHVSCICPGPTSTESVMARHQRIGNSSELLMMTPEEVAGLAIEGLLKHKGLIVPGWKNKFILGFSNVAPYVLKYYLLNKIFEKSVEKTTTYSIKPAAEIGHPLHKTNL